MIKIKFITKRKLVIIIIIIIAIILGIASLRFLKRMRGSVWQMGIGKIITQPLEKMPEVNPFKKVINPFRDLYKNPFREK